MFNLIGFNAYFYVMFEYSIGKKKTELVNKTNNNQYVLFKDCVYFIVKHLYADNLNRLTSKT